MEIRQRRTVSRLLRVGLVALALVIAGSWAWRKFPRPDHLRVESSAPAAETLVPGDLQIFNEDSTVDVILAGDRLSAGLSPQKLAQVRAELEQSTDRDTAGVGGAIAQMVKRQVADKIGLRAVYPLADIADLRWDDGRILIEWRDGKTGALLGDNVKLDNDRDANRFRRAEAERLIAAVRDRQRIR